MGVSAGAEVLNGAEEEGDERLLLQVKVNVQLLKEVEVAVDM